jgi:hypothetical protein
MPPAFATVDPYFSRVAPKIVSPITKPIRAAIQVYVIMKTVAATGTQRSWYP